MEQNPILQQEPQEEKVPLCDLKNVGGYIAYVSLDFLDTVFLDAGFRDQPEKQQEYIDEMQKQLAEVVLPHDKHGLMMSWSWTDKEGQTRRAIELMPVAASAHGLQIVTPDVTGYQQLRDKLTELETENFRLRQQMRDIGDYMKTNNIITERAFRALVVLEPPMSGGVPESP